MESAFDIIRKQRSGLLEQVKELNIEQLNEVQHGFNNNIAWNLGHLVATQQGINYSRAGLELRIDKNFQLRYKSGTRPEGFIDEDSIKEINNLLTSTIDEFEIDYNNNLFTNYTAWTSRAGMEINDIDASIKFLQ